MSLGQSKEDNAAKEMLDSSRWPQNRMMTLEGSEVWRIDQSGQTATDLCNMCQTIDFDFVLNERLEDNRDEIPIGYLDEIIAKENCPFCRLVVHSLVVFTGLNPLPTTIDGTRVKCDLRTVIGAWELPVPYRATAQKPHQAIRVVTIPPLPSSLREPPVNQESLLKWMKAARPLDTPIPWAMSSLDECFGHLSLIWSTEKQSRLSGPAKIVQHWVDFGRIRSWFKKCEKRGCPIQAAPEPPSLPQNFRLIDVQKSCLVEHKFAMTEYVALSYTWGQLRRPFIRTLKSNVQDLSQKGALLPDNPLLPHTIRDAIIAVRATGKQYLWVDSLCIVQDDADDKQQQISRMNDIYTFATITIVSAHGSDADAGLPGVPPTRRSGQLSAQVRDWTLVNRLASPLEALENAWWNSRAWTYQEAALSRRLLVFSESQVHLVCRDHAPCSEECRDVGFSYGVSVLSLSLNIGLTSFDNYINAVASYTARSLSYESDALDAFCGVAASLSDSLRSNFCFNLPDGYFDHAILWHPKHTLRRRTDANGKPLFPSWAWTAWSGEILYDYPHRLSSRLLFQAHTDIDKMLSGKPEFNSEDILPSKDWNEWKDWTRLDRSGYWRNLKIRSDYLHLHPLQSGGERHVFPLLYDPETGHTQFWTQFALFKLAMQPLPEDFAFDNLMDHEYSVSMFSFKFGCWLSIVNAAGGVVGCVNLNTTFECIAIDKLQPLILLSRTVGERGGIYGPEDYGFAPRDFEPDIPWDQRQFDYDHLSIKIPEVQSESHKIDNENWNIYNVMLLDTVEGVSSRQGVGKMWMKDFHQAHPRRIQITLG